MSSTNSPIAIVWTWWIETAIVLFIDFSRKSLLTESPTLSRKQTDMSIPRKRRLKIWAKFQLVKKEEDWHNFFHRRHSFTHFRLLAYMHTPKSHKEIDKLTSFRIHLPIHSLWSFPRMNIYISRKCLRMSEMFVCVMRNHFGDLF